VKTITNKTNKPIKIPLPGGKALHLGPDKSGQIRDEAAEHAPVQKLVDAGEIEIADGDHDSAGSGGRGLSPHQAQGGQRRSTFRQRKGDR
jgi:hypothetical protein